MMIWLGCWGVGAWAAAAPFAAPHDGPVPFRRDRLPIERESLEELARCLMVLAEGQPRGNADERRTLAQLLGLALALDPANPVAEEWRQRFSDAREIEEGKEREWPEEREQARALAWEVRTLLETHEVGKDGRALAACLTDVLAKVDSQRAQEEGIQVAEGERGTWKDWIEPIESYQVVEKTDEPPDDSRPAGAETGPAEISVREARISTPLWTLEAAPGSARPALRLFFIDLSLGKSPEPGQPYGLQWAGLPVGNVPQVASAAVRATYGELPPDLLASLHCEDAKVVTVAGNEELLTGAAALLMAAPLAGLEPQAIVVGSINDQGAFRPPPDFWFLLRSLASGAGGKLVIPAGSEEELQAILALENPGFFFRYEVLQASNLRELLERSAKTPGPPLAEWSERFHAVRGKLGAQTAGSYAAQRPVRQAMAEIAKEVPYHASARFLAIQGAGNRPTRLPSRILAMELREVMQPMAWMLPLHVYSGELKGTQLEETHKSCREMLARLERYVDAADKPWYDEAFDLTNRVRTIARFSARSDEENLAMALKSFSERYRELFRQLTAAVGDGRRLDVPGP